MLRPTPALSRCALPVFLLLAGCDQNLDVASSSEAIVGGMNTSEYPSVAHISVAIAGGGSFACSSTLITPRVLLTAAHCLDLEEGPAEAITAYFGARVTGPDPDFIQSIPAADWIFYSPWSLGGNDIALVLLEHDSDVGPVPYNTTVLGNSAIGVPLHVVGWGNTSFEVGSGRKRHMQTPITGFRNQAVMLYGDNDQNTCQGDSGGPGFLTFNDGTERVSSITSYGTQGCLGESGGTRVAPYASWIDSWIGEKDIPLPPEVTFLKPMDGNKVNAGFQVHVEAVDNTRVESVEIWINDELHTTLPGHIPPFLIATPALPDGPVKIETRAIDNRGEVGSKIINVTVDSTCDSDEDCQGALLCGEVGMCEAPDYGVGDACELNEQCSTGICATVKEVTLCTSECTPGDDATCSDGFECLKASEDLGYCWPDEGGEETGGCSASGGRSGLLGGFFVLLAPGWRRRRSTN